MTETAFELEHRVGSVNAYASERGLDPTLPDTLRDYSQALREHNLGDAVLRGLTLEELHKAQTLPSASPLPEEA